MPTAQPFLPVAPLPPSLPPTYGGGGSRHLLGLRRPSSSGSPHDLTCPHPLGQPPNFFGLLAFGDCERVGIPLPCRLQPPHWLRAVMSSCFLEREPPLRLAVKGGRDPAGLRCFALLCFAGGRGEEEEKAPCRWVGGRAGSREHLVDGATKRLLWDTTQHTPVQPSSLSCRRSFKGCLNLYASMQGWLGWGCERCSPTRWPGKRGCSNPHSCQAAAFATLLQGACCGHLWPELVMENLQRALGCACCKFSVLPSPPPARVPRTPRHSHCVGEDGSLVRLGEQKGRQKRHVKWLGEGASINATLALGATYAKAGPARMERTRAGKRYISRLRNTTFAQIVHIKTPCQVPRKCLCDP